MKLIKTVIIFSFLLSTSVFGSDSKDIRMIQKMYNAIDKLESFSCTIKYKTLKDESDTSSYYANIQYFKNVNDSLIGYSFVLNGDLSKNIYDGSYVVYLKDDIKFVSIIDDQEGITRNLSSTWCSPLSIKRLLKSCLNTDSIVYQLKKELNGDYELKIELPYFNLDGYLPLDMPLMPNQKTEYSIIFDKKSYLPKYHFRNNVGITKFTATFYNFKNIPTQKISAMDSIPKDYRSDADVAIETESKNTQAPGFKLKKFEGDSLDLYNIDSEYILLEFTNLNCGPCRSAASYLSKKYGDLKDKHIDVILIDDEGLTNIKSLSKYITDSKLPFRYLVNGDSIAKDYKVLAVPTFFLLNKDKRIIDVKVGYSEDWLNDKLETIK
jgi:thiol-disulfide isomerase/thioredoxin